MREGPTLLSSTEILIFKENIEEIFRRHYYSSQGNLGGVGSFILPFTLQCRYIF